MSELRIDRSVISAVKPVTLPDEISRTWQEAYLEPILRWLPLADATYQEWPERPDCGHFYGGSYWYAIETAYPILIYAVAYRAAEALGKARSIPAATMLERAIGAIRYLGFTHEAGPADCVRVDGDNPSAGAKWGDSLPDTVGTSAFFTSSQTGSAVAHMCLGAWLLWEHLNEETRQLAANVAAWYGERWCDEEPRIGTYDNTQTEENGWTAQGLDVAANFLQGHPRADKWRGAADKWLANITVTPYDMNRNKSELQGQPVSAWTKGATSHPDFSTENHGFVHPSYLASAIGFAGASLLTHLLAGVEVPKVVRFNRQAIYDTMKKLAEDDGAMLAVQGMDWWYSTHAALLPISTVSAHTVMNLLFEDPHAAYLERLCIQTAKQVMDSLGDGHVLTSNPEQRRINRWQSFRTYERSAMASFAGSFLLHWLMGDGAQPCRAEELKKWQQGVHTFPHGGFIIRKGARSTASFSWRNRPVVVVQPEGGTWTITPHFNSLSGTYRCDPPWQGGTRTRWHYVAEDGEGFAAMAQIQREGGKLIQNLALLVPDDHIAFFFDHTVAAEAVRITEQRSGQVGVRNEYYSEMGDLAPGKRTLYTEDACFTAVSRFGGEDEWFHTDQAVWANLDERIGYIMFGSKGLAYQAQHKYPTYRAMEDFLILSYSDDARQYAAKEVVSRLALTIFPNQTKEQTQGQVGQVLRATTGGAIDALLTPHHLALVHLGQEPIRSRITFATPEWEWLPVPDGCTATWDGSLSYTALLGKCCADLRLCSLKISRTAQWRATPAPDGRTFLELLEDRPAEVQILRQGVAQQVLLEPSQIVAV